MEFVGWCCWALNAGLPLLWRACWAVFCFGYKWADIAKASIYRYRRFVSGPPVKDRPPAERRWKMYEALWVTPMVVLEAKKEHEDGLGRLLHKWLEAFHAWCVTAEDGVVQDEGTVKATGPEEKKQAERLSEAFWRMDGYVGPRPRVPTLIREDQLYEDALDNPTVAHSGSRAKDRLHGGRR
eukprot:jgi/Phyca11/19733/fgenesh1_pg.PHYCAscaffold_51_\